MTQFHNVLAILFADICGSVSLYEALGNVEAQRLIASSVAAMAAATEAHGGRVVSNLGDGLMSVFATADAAFDAALAMQEALRGGSTSIKVCFTVGPVIEEEGNVFGDAVNTAARIMALARADEILLTEDTADRLSPANRRLTRFLDSAVVKGKAAPVNVHAVVVDIDPTVTQFLAAPAPTPDTAKGALVLEHGNQEWRLVLEGQTLILGRDEQCEVVVRSPLASRRHAVVQATRGRFIFTDQSTNGTFIAHGEGHLAFVKRETVTLQGQGLIALGEEPKPQSPCVISYRCEVVPGG